MFSALRIMADTPSVISLVTNGLFEPYGVAVDGDNNFYLSDNSHRIFKYVYDNGTMTAIAGQSGLLGTNNGPGFLSRFYSPKGVAIYGGGLVVADSGNHWLRFVTLTGNRVEVVTNFAGVPSLNQPGVASAAPVPALQARFNNPLGLTVSGTNLFIADSKNNAIRRLYPNANVGGYVVETLVITFVDPTSSFFEPSYIALGENGVLFVSDTRNQMIRELLPQADGSYQAYLLAGSGQQVAGTNDAYFAREARFNMPMGLLWEGGSIGLLVADSGNHTIRSVCVDSDLTDFFGSNVWSVSTFAGTPKTPGLLNGYVANALFKSPAQIAKDQSGGMVVIDAGNNALRRIQLEAEKPAVTEPSIGYVIYVTNDLNMVVSKLVKFTDTTFYDDAVVAISGEQQTVTYTYGVTPGISEEDTIPSPKTGSGESAPYYADGMSESEVPASIISPQPDVTIKAVGSAEGRRPSAVVSARARFKVASPQIVGDNPLSLGIEDITSEAEIWYTLGDLESGGTVPKTNKFGPYRSGDTLQLSITSNTVLKVQAFRQNWLNSEVVTKQLSVTNFSANRISFGFASGEASSEFKASAGQKFYAPITLSLLASETIYSLQFNTRVASIEGSPVVNPSSITFTSMLWKPLAGADPVVYVRINPLMTLASYATNIITDAQLTSNIFWTNEVVDVQVTNTTVSNIPVVTNIDFVTNYVDMGFITNYISKTNNATSGTYQIVTNVSIDTRVTNYYYVVAATNVYYLSVTNVSRSLDSVTNWYEVTNYDVVFYNSTNYSYDLSDTNLVIVNTNTGSGNLADLGWDPSSQLLMTAWLERMQETNLYNTIEQDLVTYSMAHNHMYKSSDGKVIVGSYAFEVPPTAVVGDKYLLQIGRPSGTSDGVDTDVYIDAPTNGSLSIGAINAVKHLTIGLVKYVVGDSTPFRWFNAGDFGDGSILNNDILDLFQSVAYWVNVPMEGSDFFDSMDSASSVVLADPVNGSDYRIDDMKYGDGVLGVDDIYVNYRRALDPTLKWYARYWQNGVRVAEETPNIYRGSRAALPKRKAAASVAVPAKAKAIKQSTATPVVQFVAGEFQAQPGQTVSVPIEAKIAGRFPVRVLLLNLDVVPLNGAPALAEAIQFEPAVELGSPEYTASTGAGNFSAAWLDASVAGLWGDSVAGNLRIKIPATAPAASYYQIVFTKTSASPSGLGTFPQTARNGLVKLTAGSRSSWNDGIPDTWRFRYFGSLTDPASAAALDADGDGVSNWAEYKAGTNPKDANSVLRLQSRMDKSELGADGKPAVILYWSSVEGTRYIIEAAASLSNPQWTPVANDLAGTGEEMECKDISGSDTSYKYYRVRVAE